MKAVRMLAVSALVALAGAAAQQAIGRQELPGQLPKQLPGGLRGFSGRVRGVVKDKGAKHTFSFKVGRVLDVWEGNKAGDPRSIIGHTVSVGPRWVKGDNGKWHPVEGHVVFIRKLKKGQELTLEIRNSEAAHFAILELSGDQRAWAKAEGGDRKPGHEPGEKLREKPGAGDRELEKLVRVLKEKIERLDAQNDVILRMLVEQREEIKGLRKENARLRRIPEEDEDEEEDEEEEDEEEEEDD